MCWVLMLDNKSGFCWFLQQKLQQKHNIRLEIKQPMPYWGNLNPILYCNFKMDTMLTKGQANWIRRDQTSYMYSV